MSNSKGKENSELAESNLDSETALKSYVCGGTAYDYSHIGHAQDYVAFDVLYRKGRTKTLTFDLNYPPEVFEQTLTLSKLPYDMLVEIAKRLKRVEDFTCFRSVSNSLHAVVKEEFFEGLRLRQGTPYLMLPVRDDDTNGDVRDLYSLVKGESIVHSLKVPRLKSSTMCAESLGWLLAVQADGSMSLLEPLSNTEIPVPHPNTIPEYDYYCNSVESMFIEKMVLSSRPNETSNFILVAICGHTSSLAFWISGDTAWDWMDDYRGGICDVVYDGGEQFYAVDCQGAIWAINVTAENVEWRIIIDHAPVLHMIGGEQKQYLVKTTNGSLRVITRSKELKYYLTSVFKVYEVDTVTSTLTEIYSLGGTMSVFLGRNSSIAVDASKFPVVKPNHIYFTDDFWEFQWHYFMGSDWRAFSNYSTEARGGCVDSGVYNIETQVVELIYPVKPLLSNVSPAMWINPNSCF